MAKQYQVRLSDSAAKFLDRECAKHTWSPPVCMNIIIHTFERAQQLAKVFTVAEDEDGETHVLATMPYRGREDIEGQEAVDLLGWILTEMQKGLVCSFVPDGIEPEETPSYFDALGDYPENGIGTAMAAIDYLYKLPKLGKEES